MIERRCGGLAAGSILLLVLFLAAGVYFRMREPVTLQDITVKVTAQDQTVSLKLWHNYYDGKEYLFLPSSAMRAQRFGLSRKPVSILIGMTGDHKTDHDKRWQRARSLAIKSSAEQIKKK